MGYCYMNLEFTSLVDSRVSGVGLSSRKFYKSLWYNMNSLGIGV